VVGGENCITGQAPDGMTAQQKVLRLRGELRRILNSLIQSDSGREL